MQVEPRVAAAVRLLERHGVRAEAMLDIGCSDGGISRLVASVTGARRVYGVDVDPDSVIEARARGVSAFLCDVSRERIPLPSSAVDLVTAFEVIEHLLDPDHMLSEAWRVLRSGGYLLASTPNLGSWVNRLLLLAGYQPYTAEVSAKTMYGVAVRGGSYGSRPSGHIRPFTLRAFREILEANGFRVLELVGAPGVEPRNRVFRLVDRLMARRPSLARRLVALAVKTGKGD